MRINLASVFVDDQEKGPAVKPFKEALVADGIPYTSRPSTSVCAPSACASPRRPPTLAR